VVTTSADHTVELWDVLSGRLLHTLEGHKDIVFTATFSSDSKYLFTWSLESVIILWSVSEGCLLIRHFIFDDDPDEWLHLHPSGLLDASPEAMDMIYWIKGLELIEFSQHKDRYWTPGLWKMVMEGKKLPEVRGMN